MQRQVPGAAATGGGASAPGGIPDIRYSTARSGLLYAARMALTTSSRGNPMSTICTPLLVKPCGIVMQSSIIWCGTIAQQKSTRHVRGWIVLEHEWCGTDRQYDTTRHEALEAQHANEAKENTPSMLCFRLSPVAKFDAAEAYGSPLDAGAAVAAPAARVAAVVLGAGVAVGAEAGAGAAVAEVGAALQSTPGSHPACGAVRTLHKWEWDLVAGMHGFKCQLELTMWLLVGCLWLQMLEE